MKKAAAFILCCMLLLSLPSCATEPAVSTAVATASTSLSPSLIPSIDSTTVPLITIAPTFTPEPSQEETPAEEPEETEEPEPAPEYDIPDLKKVGLTNEQYQKIELLLYGALGMYDENSEGRFIYFNKIDKISTYCLMNYATRILGTDASCIGFDHRDLYGKDEIEKIVNSAFPIGYQAQEGDKNEGSLEYHDGEFNLSTGDGDAVLTAQTYSITKTKTEQLCVKFDVFIVGGGMCANNYVSKAQAILQKDRESLFGYHFVSLSKIKTYPSFNNANASSWLSDTDTKSFMPEYCIDDEITTGWATDKGTGEWLKVSSSKTQVICGLSFYIGDRSMLGEEDDFDSGEMTVKLEFSNGMTYDWEILSACYKDDYYSISFGREIKTKYIKITIVSADNSPIYIAEIKPF